MIRIANFVIDEKFIDWQIEYQDLTKKECQHDYYFVGSKNFKYIKKEKDRVRRINIDSVISITNNYDAVFLHSIFSMPLELISIIDKRVKVFWFSWGYDIYNSPRPRPLIRLNLYHSATKRYMHGDIKRMLFNTLLLLRNIINKRGSKYYYKAIKRVNYFSGIIPEEYSMVKNSFPNFKALATDYSYCCVSQFPSSDNFENCIKNGNNIIVGNSTAYTNNHLDILESLKGVDLGSRKIIVPLSYSPNPRYVQRVQSKGQEIFGDKFVALTSFLSVKEYNDVINSCSICIFGSERQQGMGLVISSLYNGVKLFLYETSIIYRHCQNLGLKVYSIEKDLAGPNAFAPLTEEEALFNRKIIYGRINRDVMVKKLHDIYVLIS